MKYTKKMIEAEADKIFMKLNPNMAMKNGKFPLVNSRDASPEYNNEYKRTYNQVKKTRMGMNK